MAGNFEKLLGNPVGEAAAFAGGLAIHPVLRPILQELTNLTWDEFRSLPLEAMLVAEAVAHGHIEQDAGAAEAALTGISTDRFSKLVTFAKVGPGVASAFELWRRDKIGDAQFHTALLRSGIEQEWIDALVEIKERVLDPAVIATAIQRGVMTAPFALPYNAQVPEGTIKPFPVSPLDAAAEAAGSGWTLERLRVETALVGLPMALDRAARATFRGIIDDNDFLRAVLEGNARGEWADAELQVAREILTSNQYAELELRGFYDRDTRLANTGKHGMTDADSDLLYDVLGRAVAVHAVTTGLARGGKYPGSYANVPEPYRSAIQRSNIREEWSEIAYANRYSYPSGFQIRSEAKAGDLDTATTTELLLEVGWSPRWAAFFAEKWTGAKTSTATTPATTATKAAIRAVAKTYTNAKRTRAEAETELTQLGVPQAEWAALFNAWDVTREATVQGLTNAQLRRAYRANTLTLDEALARLEANGLSAADAALYLA